MSSVALCPDGHPLESKKVSGGVLGGFTGGALALNKKTCEACGQFLEMGRVRYTCYTCSKSYCRNCHDRMLDHSPKLKTGKPIGRSGSGPVPPVPPFSPASMAATPSSGPGRPTLRTAKTMSGTPCKWGAACYNHDPEHRSKFLHPVTDSESSTRRRACRYGRSCFRKDQQHRLQFAHPGDRYYRTGLVDFEGERQPELDTLRELFQFYDPDESGHMSKDEFREALVALAPLTPDGQPLALQESWIKAGGDINDYLNFRQFVAWTVLIGVALPLGLDDAESMRPCRFLLPGRGGKCCPCEEYQEGPDGFLCVCGHKPSMHRSDVAEMSVQDYFERSVTKDLSEAWDGKEGLVEVQEVQTLSKLQTLLMSTHKKEDNWTRDRGCKIHGVNGCKVTCASMNRVPVPTGYVIVKAFRNQNVDLWKKYSLHREQMRHECYGKYNDKEGFEMRKLDILSSSMEVQPQLQADCNEWLLFHGSSYEACKGICSSNFRRNKVGCGATWKDPGKATGTPLYGFGYYFAERITKADEYAATIPASSKEAGLHAVLICRVVGGRANVVDTNEIEVEKLRKSVFDGPCHSVLGDRMKTMGKPYREVVVYDKDQIYPEYLLLYRRKYD